MRKLMTLLLLIVLIFLFSGCGETLLGISKDVKRMGKGIKTIFVRETE